MARTAKYGKELLDERVVLTLTSSQLADLKERVGSGDMSHYMRERIFGMHNRDLIDAGLNLFRGPYISTVPCGDWDTAIDVDEDFVLSEDVKNELDAHAGDVFVRTRGQSMEGQGIFDDAVLLVRPIEPKHPPRKGDATIVQIATSDGTYLGTLKTWIGTGTPPELQDGNGNAFEYPSDAVSVEPVAVVKGVIWRYS